MELIPALIELLIDYSYLLSFIGGIINEEILTILAVLSGKGKDSGEGKAG